MISPFLADFIAGCVSGWLCVIVGYPFETIKVRQQNYSTSFLIATRVTIKYEGILGFYKGLTAPLISYGPSNSLFFGVFGAYMRIFNGSGPEAPSHMYQRKQYFLNLFNAGCVAGFCQVGVMCPFELVKIVQQTTTEGKSPLARKDSIAKCEGTIDCFRNLYRLSGIRGWYKGFVPMVIRDVPTSGLYFIVYEGLLPNDRKEAQWYHKIWGGGWAGIASISTVLPIDVVKTRIQADDLLYPHYNGTTDCFIKLYREEGLRIFWKGLPVITARAFPAHAMLFIGYEFTMDKLGAAIM